MRAAEWIVRINHQIVRFRFNLYFKLARLLLKSLVVRFHGVLSLYITTFPA